MLGTGFVGFRHYFSWSELKTLFLKNFSHACFRLPNEGLSTKCFIPKGDKNELENSIENEREYGTGYSVPQNYIRI